MAKPDLFLAFDAVRGRHSEFVYGRRGNRMYFYPRRSGETASAAVLAVRRRFSDAAEHAKAVLADPAKRAPYEPIAENRRVRLRQVIITDYLRKPVVTEFDLAAFTGAVGDLIKVRAEDDCGVMGVTVALHAEDGSLLEEGPATKEGNRWVYAATAAYPAGSPVLITATAVDRPGNRGSLTVPWPEPTP